MDVFIHESIRINSMHIYRPLTNMLRCQLVLHQKLVPSIGVTMSLKRLKTF